MRKNYLDNIRWSIVLVVVVYHVIYLFNSVGVISNIQADGIPIMDSFLYFLYPWFMACLFVVAGMSARYSLQKRSAKEFAKERVRRLLVPSISVMFIWGWMSGYITNCYVDIFAGESVPGLLRYIIFSLMGIGPLWFLHELFLVSMILLIIRKIDKNDRIWNACGNVNIVIVFLLFLGVWSSSFLFNAPLITVYRSGIYLFMFLLGYYLFSHDNVQNMLLKWHLPLMIAAVISGIIYVMLYYGQDYTSTQCLTNPFTNFYAWIAILAILGCGQKWFDFSNPFTKYMSSRSFAVYVLHYPCMVVIAYVVTHYLNVPILFNYLMVLIGTIVVVLPISELIMKVPLLRFLILGIKKERT